MKGIVTDEASITCENHRPRTELYLSAYDDSNWTTYVYGCFAKIVVGNPPALSIKVTYLTAYTTYTGKNACEYDAGKASV